MKLPPDVRKEVVVPAEGPFNILPPYPPGTRIGFHFRTVLESTKDVIDDTHTLAKPMELVIGKKFKLEVWEAALHTMHPGEQAKFHVPKHWVECYPMVSKAVRDAARPHSERTHQHHCCGMMKQGIGYPDLDKLLENPQSMTFIFEVLKVEAPGEYEQESWQLTEEEKLASVPVLQAEGNDLFAKGKVNVARQKYFEAIARLEQLSLRERPGSEEATALEEQKVPLLLNYALCLMKESEFYEALQHLSTAISLQPENVKGLFRRGKCHRLVGNFEEARTDYGRVLELDPTLKGAISKELDQLHHDEKQKDLKDKDKFKKIFTEL